MGEKNNSNILLSCLSLSLSWLQTAASCLKVTWLRIPHTSWHCPVSALHLRSESTSLLMEGGSVGATEALKGLHKRGSWLHRPCLYLLWHCFKAQPNILITVRASTVVGVTVCLSSALHFYKYTKLGLSIFKNIPLCAAQRYLHRCSDRGTDTFWNSYELPFLERCVWRVSLLKNADPFSIFHHFQ